MSPKISVLSPELSGALEDLGRQIDAGGPIDPARARKIATDLAALPADSVRYAGYEILHAARLYSRGPGMLRETQGRASLFGRMLARLESPVVVWMNPRARDLHLLDATPSLALPFLFHGDGFVREQALNSLEECVGSPFVFSAIAFRLNDWVPQVADAAQKCGERLFAFMDASVVAAAASYLLRVTGQWGRWRPPVRAVLDAAFSRGDVCAVLAAWLCTETSGAAGPVLRRLLRHPAIDEHLPVLVREAVSPAVRALALQCQLSGEARWIEGARWSHALDRREPVILARPIRTSLPFELAVKIGSEDRSAPVRKLAVDAITLHRREMAALNEMIARFANEKNNSVLARLDFLRRKLSEERAEA